MAEYKHDAPLPVLFKDGKPLIKSNGKVAKQRPESRKPEGWPVDQKYPHKTGELDRLAAQRRAEAIERNESWAKLTPQQKLAELDKRLGKGTGAGRQRARIARELESLKAPPRNVTGALPPPSVGPVIGKTAAEVAKKSKPKPYMKGA